MVEINLRETTTTTKLDSVPVWSLCLLHLSSLFIVSSLSSAQPPNARCAGGFPDGFVRGFRNVLVGGLNHHHRVCVTTGALPSSRLCKEDFLISISSLIWICFLIFCLNMSSICLGVWTVLYLVPLKPQSGLYLLVRGGDVLDSRWCTKPMRVVSLVGSFSGSASKLVVVALVSVFPDLVMLRVGFVRLERAFNAHYDLSRDYMVRELFRVWR